MERSVSVNLMTQNQMALHAQNGCTKANSSLQTGTNGTPNCTDGPGCSVLETNPNSVGAAFASAQGGVWATQFDASGQSCLIILITHCADTQLQGSSMVMRYSSFSRLLTIHPSDTLVFGSGT